MRVPPGAERFCEGLTRVLAGFYKVLQGLRVVCKVPPGSAGWAALRLTGSHRVPQGFHKGSTRLHQVSQGFRKCCARFCGLPWREAVRGAPAV